ncbi:MCE family protein [Aquihabitans sp. G128]|uniref:MlaD family protein n=1 Tax=Aquihabitans sp. G128 TaxID=2849779 RepID=UPI001C2333B3|nr:MCE family protein [Aquihabitans sp. G128]QXC61952.1 MCE family protein [Aquihabitans sp. G128]
MANTPEELQKAYRAIAAIVVVVLFAGLATVAVRTAYGAFSDDFHVTTRFARAGQALKPGSDVKYRGVTVGKVRSIDLVDRRVKVVMQLHKDVEVPKATSATVRPKTLFGEKYVELKVVPGDRAPFLADGDTVKAAGTGEEVEELLDSTDKLLRAVDIDEVATLMDELTKAAQGEGDNVAHLIDRSVGATAVIRDTLDAQLKAIDSLARFARQYRDIGPSINDISGNLNDLLPTFNAARADYERLLVTLRPFADHLSDFIEVNEADIGKLLDNGDNIVRVLTARKKNISETVYGLSRYMQTFAGAIGEEQLPDGSRFGYLKVFVEAGDLSALICNTLGPTGAVADLSAVREALAAIAPVLACKGDGAATAGTPGGTAAPGSAGSTGGGAATDPLTALTDGVTDQVAQPDTATPTGSVADILAPAVGGGG